MNKVINLIEQVGKTIGWHYDIGLRRYVPTRKFSDKEAWDLLDEDEYVILVAAYVMDHMRSLGASFVIDTDSVQMHIDSKVVLTGIGDDGAHGQAIGILECAQIQLCNVLTVAIKDGKLL